MDNPITRKEMYLAAAAGEAVDLPEPITREEQYLKKIAERSLSGGNVDLTDEEYAELMAALEEAQA